MNLNNELNNFFLAYGQEQASLAKHLSNETELDRKSRALFSAVQAHYGDEMPNKIVLSSPYGTILLTIDTCGETIRKIEGVENFNIHNPKKHDRYLTGLNASQLAGLGTLIFLSIREKTTIAYQWKEWGFADIPHETIEQFQNYFEQLSDAEMLQIVNSIAIAIYKTYESA